jgi:dTDP-4-dehydrorhamnose 3,5-epimerase
LVSAQTKAVPPFEFLPTPLSGVTIVQRQRFEDSRGFLSRFYCAEQFRTAGVETPLAQINYTLTHRAGAVRGMHFQWPPHAETKLVSCVRGKVFDVAVDLRRNSPTFLTWHAEILSPDNQRSLLIREGFAHGFQALIDESELLYLHTAAYHPAAEGAVNAIDPRLAINWPLPIAEMSERDRSHPLVTPAFEGISL